MMKHIALIATFFVMHIATAQVTVNKKSKGVYVAPEVLEQYEGTYPLMPGFNLKIFIKDGTLMAQSDNQPAYELYAESQTVFHPLKFETKLTFREDMDGLFTELKLEQGGQEFILKRVAE